MKRRQFINSITALSGMLATNSFPAFSDNSDLNLNINNLETGAESWETIRKKFIFPEDYTYLNTGGIGAVPEFVVADVANDTREQQIYPRPGHDHNRWEDVKEKCAGILGTSCSKDEIALTSCTTEGINIILNGLPLEKGDEVITSMHEHPALHVPLLNKLKRNGIVIKTFDPDFKNGLSNVDAIEKLISKRTKLIFISHITCTCGQNFPIKEIELTPDEALKQLRDNKLID